jgi:hypothetical protein
MNCRCTDQLPLPSPADPSVGWRVEGQTIHTRHGCYHASLFLGTDGERFILENARTPSAPSPRDEGRAREALQLAAALPAAWERIADERFPIGEGLYADDANQAGAMVARSWLRECAADLREALAPAACAALASLGTEGR